MTEKRGAENHPGGHGVPTSTPAGPGEFLKEESGRGRLHGGIVLPDQPTFTQPKNGVAADQGGERLTFETDIGGKEIRRGNRNTVDEGY